MTQVDTSIVLSSLFIKCQERTTRLCQLVSLNEKPSIKYNLFNKMVFCRLKQTTPGSPKNLIIN